MMRMTSSNSGKSRVLKLSGSLTVASSGKLRKAVISGLEKDNGLELVLGKVEEVDLSFLQIIASASKTAREENKKFAVRLPVPDPVVEAVILSGLANHGSCDDASCAMCSIGAQSSGD